MTESGTARHRADAAPLSTATRHALRRVIVFLNGKGGTGKTTSVANLASLYAEAGYRVLAIDFDPQGNLGLDLGYTAAGLSDGGAQVASCLAFGQPDRLSPINNVRERLDVLAGGPHLSTLLASLLAKPYEQRLRSLAESLAQIAHMYDLVLIDCPPNIEVLQEVALAASHYLVIPTKSDAASRIEGVQQVAERFEQIRNTINPDLHLLGVYLFAVGTSATRVRQAARSSLDELLGGVAPVLDSSIRFLEAAAFDAREGGQVAHEVEREIAKGPKWWQKLRNPGESPGETLAASAATLAQDFQALAAELLAEMAKAEGGALSA